jgi:hypothetical protein
MTAVWKGMVKAEGLKSLFQGMGSPLATAAFQNAVSFQTYGTAAGVILSMASATPPVADH